MKTMEDPGIDPGTSRMLSERSTIWANPPTLTLSLSEFILEFSIIQSKLTKNPKTMEDPGIDPGSSHMQSECSTIWANPPSLIC